MAIICEQKGNLAVQGVVAQVSVYEILNVYDNYIAASFRKRES